MKTQASARGNTSAPRVWDVVIVGAGQAGVSLSYWLQQEGISHLLLERERVFASWYSRWDAFRVNTPNWMNTLPGMEDWSLLAKDRDGFATRAEILDYLEMYRDFVSPPVLEGEQVMKAAQDSESIWTVHTREHTYRARSLVVCTGAMSTPRYPKVQSSIPESVQQLHSSEYRRSDQISSGRVLLVGSGSSGTQICRDLCESGRATEIHMATSDVLVLPRRFLGIPVHRFLHLFGLFNIRAKSRLGRMMYFGLETKGDPIVRPAPRDLSRDYGVILHGKLAAATAGSLEFDNGESMGTDDLTIIWCTGFRGDYAWIHPASGERITDEVGNPLHTRGEVQGATGLYFVGLRYQHTVASHDLYGVGDDALHISNLLTERSRLHEIARREEGAGGE